MKGKIYGTVSPIQIARGVGLAFCLTASFAAYASAVVVNFDDLGSSPTDLTASGYAGLTWEQGNAGFLGNLGFWGVAGSESNHPHSAPNVVVNAWGCTQIGIGFPQPVNVLGAYIANQGDPGAPGTSMGISVRGYLLGQLVATTSEFTNIDATPDWFEMNLFNVDRIVFDSVPSSGGAGWFGMDDLTYTPVPEPSGLLLANLATMALQHRRRRPVLRF